MKETLERGRAGRAHLRERFIHDINRVAVFRSIGLISILLAAIPLFGQATVIDDPERALTQYRIDTWQTEQGLPLNTVQVLHQTSDGYLWVGTGGGLARFDGIRFRTFEDSDMRQLSSRPIFGLMEDSRGNLWVGDTESAMTFRDGELREMFGRDVTNGMRVWGFAEADDGTIWSATANGLVSWREGEVRLYQLDDGLPALRLRGVAIDRDGLLWLATTGGGLASFDGENFDVFDTTRGLPHDEVRHVIADPRGGVWAATAGGGLVHVRERELRTWGVEDGLPTDQLVQLSLDQDGSLWIGTWGEGLVRMRGEKFTSISEKEGLAGSQIWSVHADSEGSVWVGTWAGGLSRLRHRDFVILGSPEGLSHDNVRSVIHARDGSAWVTTSGGGVNRIHDGRITVIDAENGLPSNEASSIHQDRDGAIWVGTYTAGLARIDQGTITTYGLDEGLPSVDVRVIYEDDEGTIWAGTIWGLARFDGNRFVTVQQEGAPEDGISAILQDHHGALWFGTTGQGLVRYRDGVFETFTRENGLVSNWIMSLHEDAEGTLWVGTNGEGINRIRDGEIIGITPEDGLWDGIIQTLLEDSFGYLWITCNRGFYRVAIADLNAFAEGRSESVSSDAYGPGNALRSTTFAGGVQPAGAIDSSGNLWLPGFKGLVIVDPKNLPGTGDPPPVILEEATVDGVRMSLDQPVVIPPGSAPLSIRYTAASLSDADRAMFRYHMEGTGSGWVNAGDKREAFFAALPHGDYTFRVAVSVDGQHWREAPSAVSVIVEPYFFQTGWFILLITLIVVALIAGGGGLRIHRLRHQKVEMERLVAEKTEELRKANEHLERLSFVDALTGLPNRRKFDETLQEEWRRAARAKTPLSLIIADVDRFKDYNDALGHPAGDQCLRDVGELLREKTRRAGELVARYGGEEFLILAPGIDHEHALQFAEKLREAVASEEIPHPASDVAASVTVSLGVATMIPAPDGEAESLVRRADEALYRAKREGRNAVRSA